MFLVVIVVIGIISGICHGKITDKQYASMPTLFHLDHFDKCMLLEDSALYCSFTYELEPLNSSNTSEIWKIVNEVSSDKYNYRHDHLRHGICVPFTCPNTSGKSMETLRQEITDCYDRKFYDLGLKGAISSITCETNKPKYPVDFLDVVFAIFFILYITMIIYGTYYEGMARYKPEVEYKKLTTSYWGKIFSAFSITKNWEELVTVKLTPETEKLKCLQGVRFYNTLLVLLTHIVMTVVSGPVINTKFTEGVNDRYMNLFLSSGSLSVSTNFMMSAFLLCYGIFSHFENKKEIEPKYLILAFINRYIRLTPTLFAVVMFHATWLRHLGRGPNWNNFIGKEYLRCRQNWWTNILYINNIIGKENMCLVPTWYLALDTQYFVILLLIIMFMQRYPKLIWTILATLLSTNIVATFIQNYSLDFPAFLIPYPEVLYDMKNVYGHPQFYYQIASFIGCIAGPIVGLGYGYVFYQYKNKNFFKKIGISEQIMFYIIGFGGSLSLFLIPGFFILYLRVPHNIYLASLYSALSRPIFSLTVGYVLFGSMFGVGWLSKYVLEWPPLYVLGRLTYTAYLIHMSLQLYKPAIARSPVFVNEFLLFRGLLEDLSITYLAALLLTLIVELPVSQLQKLLLPVKQDTSAVPTKEDKKL